MALDCFRLIYFLFTVKPLLSKHVVKDGFDHLAFESTSVTRRSNKALTVWHATRCCKLPVSNELPGGNGPKKNGASL